MDTLVFTGSFEIVSGTASGTAFVSVSGTDLVGNSYSGPPSGPALVIDTDGPIGSVAFGLPEPVQVMAPFGLDVSLTLTEAVQAGTQPLLRFIPPIGDIVTVPLIGADNDWQGAKAHFGLVLSGEKLINDPHTRDVLLEAQPEAIGGEMEGAGLYAAAREAKVDWILVKAICDWADGNKNDDAQPLAAHNAAQFVKHVLRLGDNWT